MIIKVMTVVVHNTFSKVTCNEYRNWPVCEARCEGSFAVHETKKLSLRRHSEVALSSAAALVLSIYGPSVYLERESGE